MHTHTHIHAHAHITHAYKYTPHIFTCMHTHNTHTLYTHPGFFWYRNWRETSWWVREFWWKCSLRSCTWHYLQMPVYDHSAPHSQRDKKKLSAWGRWYYSNCFPLRCLPCVVLVLDHIPETESWPSLWVTHIDIHKSTRICTCTHTHTYTHTHATGRVIMGLFGKAVPKTVDNFRYNWRLKSS